MQRLYTSLCRSVGPSVGLSVGQSVTHLLLCLFGHYLVFLSHFKSCIHLFTSPSKNILKKILNKKILKKIFVSTAYLANNEHPNIIIGGLKVIFQVLQTNFICFLPRVFEISWILSSNGLLILSPQEAQNGHTNSHIQTSPFFILQRHYFKLKDFLLSNFLP